MAAARPHVSIITPVYNGARFLAEAIESVRAQTYSSWDYVIADNCSTDATPDIAERYARLDPRIRYWRGDTFLPIIANWNRALTQLLPDAKYCKVLHADDRLFPECLDRMVALMESAPSVAITSAYVLCDREVQGNGLPFDREVWDGREICRNTLLGQYYLFGSPSSLLMRADLVRGKADGFYNPDNIHADFEICYELLGAHDFGFVHQVLTFTRTHSGSMGNTFSRYYNPQLVEYLGMLRKYGPRYLDNDTYARLLADQLRTYRRLIARRILTGRGGDYVKFHREKLARLGYRFGPVEFVQGLGAEFAFLLRHPGEARRLLSRAISQAQRSRP